MKKTILFAVLFSLCAFARAQRKTQIWDNRCMAIEEEAEGANLGFTVFEKVSGDDIYPGMLIREIK